MEWLIDIIKEWVLSLAYATEAWVLEWITPYSVSGDLTPDATCTYFKAGTFGGKPYYKSSRADWYIWWYAEPNNEWWISSAVGNADNGWYRTDPNIVGDYIHWHYSGTPTVAVGRKFLCTGFVDRGDPASEDFTDADLTEDGTWRDLDLSSIVPEGATGVALTVRTRNAAIGKTLLFRKNGNVNAFAVSEQRILVANVFHSMDAVVSVDADRKIEYNADAPDNWLVIITVKGWWL